MYDIQCSFCEGIYYLPLHYSILIFIIKEIDIQLEKRQIYSLGIFIVLGFQGLQWTFADIFIVMETTVPARALVSLPIELQRASCR